MSFSRRFRPSYVPHIIFLVALTARFVAIPLSVLRINPYAKGDAIGFAAAASSMAQRLLTFQSPFGIPGRSPTYELWGVFLAPFWLLPGPSRIYALVFVSGLGAVAIYNVACLTQWFHSPRAAVFAALPLALYPSIVLTHAVLLREAAVLFGITCAARYLIAQPPEIRTSWCVVIAGAGLTFATIQRTENLPLYLGTLAVGCAALLSQRWPRIKKTGPLMAPIALAIIIPFLSSAVEYLVGLRNKRARGRTVYLDGISLTSIVDLFSFSWVGAAYFLFSPFPWMIKNVSDVLIGIEALFSLLFAVCAVLGLPRAFQRHPPATISLLVGFLVAVVFYGFGTANVGTAVRHRPMFLWVIFLLGGIGFADGVKIPF